jgi:hypothetical protein
MTITGKLAPILAVDVDALADRQECPRSESPQHTSPMDLERLGRE